jgi:hypothetical protein
MSVQPLLAKFAFEHTIFLDQIGNHPLLVALHPAGNHGNENLQDHDLSSGKHDRYYSVAQYTLNLRSFNWRESAELFNKTGVA